MKTSLASIGWKVLMQTVWSSPSSTLFSGCDSSCLHVVASAIYDGASNMSDNRNDVATQISTEEKHEIYVHRYGHALNLDVGEQSNSPNFV